MVVGSDQSGSDDGNEKMMVDGSDQYESDDGNAASFSPD